MLELPIIEQMYFLMTILHNYTITRYLDRIKLVPLCLTLCVAHRCLCVDAYTEAPRGVWSRVTPAEPIAIHLFPVATPQG